MQQTTFFSLEQVIDRQPLTVSPQTPLHEVIALMQEWGNSCGLVDGEDGNPENDTVGSNSSCVLVVKGDRLLGIFTERDLVKLVAVGRDIRSTCVGEMMTQELVTLTPSGDDDVFTALSLLRERRIRHLPVVDENHNLIGLITAKSLRQKLQPINLMKWRKAREVMDTEVIRAAPDNSVRSIAILMSEGNASCVAICEPIAVGNNSASKLQFTGNSSTVKPIGIITERDIVQYQNQGLDLEQPARNLMSAPLFLVSPEDSLWNIYQQMKQRRVRRLLIAGDRQELLGVVTQTSLLQVFEPTEMYGVIEVLQRQVCQLESEQERLLEERNSQLEREVRERAAVIAIRDRELAFHMNNSPLAVVEWDSEFRVKRWSQRAEQMFGWQEAEVIGKHWSDWQFVLEADSENVMGIITRLRDGIEPRNISLNRNYTKDGSVIDCEWYNSILLDEAGNLVSILSLVQNDTERQNALCDRILAEQQLKTGLKQQQVIAELGQFALATNDLTSISERVVNLVTSTLNVEYCKVLELMPNGKELILKAGVGWHDGLVGTARVPADTNSQAGYTLLQSQPVIVTDLNSETRFSGPLLLTEHQVVSGVSVIIPDGSNFYGILGVHTTQYRIFTQDDLNFIQAIANIIAQACERKQAETALKASEQKFNSILSSLDDIVWSVDAQTLKLVYINQAAENIYGHSVAEFYRNDRLWLEAVHPEDRDRVSCFPQKILEAGTHEIEYRIVRPDGEIRWLLDRANLTYDAEDRPMRLDGNATNITQRKQAETLLRESQERYTLAVEGSSNALWDWNVITNKVFYAPRWKEILGCTDADLPNTFEAWSSRLHPEESDRVLAALQDHLKNRVSYNIEYRLRKENGDYCWVQARGQAIWNKLGQPVRMAGSITNIGDRKRRERILQDIASGVSVQVGENFFHSLVEFLSKTLEVNFAFVSKLIGSQVRKVETLAVYGNGENINNFIYSLANAPCGNVIEQGLCLYPEAVRQSFPGISPLEVMQAESYAGMPIFDAAGDVLGLVAVVDSQPFSDTILIEEVLRIFASRASAELERQQAELELKQSERKFKGIFDQSFQFIGLLEPSGNLIEANKTALDFVGLTPEDVRGELFWETPWWSNSLKAQELLKQGIERAATGEFVRFEVEHSGTDNRVVTVDFSLTPIKDEMGNVVMLIPEGRNINDRKQAEAKIRQQAALLDIANDAIMVRDSNDRILFWNRGAEKLYGWSKAEALNKNAEELFNRKSTMELSKIHQAVRERGEWQGELNQVTKAEQEIVVKSRWTLVKDEAGDPQAYLVVKTDITEQKQLETQFLRTQRLESLGTLAGGIAHDLNNILAPILGFSKLLPLKLPDVDEQTKGFFKIMENNANRGTALVKQILTFSRGLEGDKGIVQIRHLIAEIGQIINETFPKSIKLETNAPKTLWTVNADINQLHQVLMNLSVNARDAMPDGGHLTINAENTTVDAEYARLHLDATEGFYVLITVSDTGVGIAPKIIDRIFEPFFTTKEVGRGTGLGLSTVIGIIKSHDGFVEVISDKNRPTHGTKFKVFLPASERAENDNEEAEEILDGNGELILVVDDESAILEVTKATLETYNYQVLTASNGIEAIAVYARNQDKIDLVMTDIMMPRMDGKTAIRTLKQINPDLKIIAVSGLIDREIIASLDGAVTTFLNKPYSNDDLLKIVREIVSSQEHRDP